MTIFICVFENVKNTGLFLEKICIEKNAPEVSHYNDNLMVLIKSLAAIGSGTRGSLKAAQMGSKES